jgi:hypothetical protein
MMRCRRARGAPRPPNGSLPLLGECLSLTSREAIYQACPKHFRPIIMSTMGAMFRAVPLPWGRPSTLSTRYS